jgi:hypothetical protein
MSGMAEHRVPMLGSSWRRNEDPAQSRDPRVRAVVGALAALPAPDMDAEFRAELRAQLVAITPRIVGESTDAPAPDADRPRPKPAPARHSDRFLDRARRVRLGRPLAVTAAVIVAFAVLLGGAVAMSRKALPGDALYGLKRASERVQLATAGSDSAKARDYLHFAATRAEEARDLIGHRSAAAAPGVHAAGGMSAGTAALVRSTLASADADVQAASRLLGTQAVKHTSATPLGTITAWTPGQLARLNDIAAAAPDPSLRARAQQSARLVQDAQTRATQLRSTLASGCTDAAHRDTLGPIPSTVCSGPTQPGPNPGSGSGATTGKPHGTRSSTGAGPGPDRASSTRSGGSNAAPQPAGSSTPAAPGSSSSTSGGGLHLPPLLPTGSSKPVDVNTCGASVSLPLLGGIGLDVCQTPGIKVGG